MKHFRRIANNRGFVLVWGAAFMIVSVAIAALAVDLGYSYVVSNELKAVADAAALTASSSFVNELREAVAEGTEIEDIDPAVIETAVKNTVAAISGRSRVLNLSAHGSINIRIQFGNYAFDSQPYVEGVGTQFTDRTEGVRDGSVPIQSVTAFRVIASRGETGGNMQFFFARFFNVTTFRLQRESVSILAPRNFIFVIDTSGSMDDISYVPGTSSITLPFPPEESFIIYPPSTEDATVPLFSPYAPGPTERYTGFDPIIPQPLQVALDSSLEFLEGLSERQSLGDSASINYFADNVTEKIALIPTTEDNVNDVFSPLLQNTQLYGNLEKGPETDTEGNALPPHFVMREGSPEFNFTTLQYNGPIAIPYGKTNMGTAINASLAALNASTTLQSQSISVILLMTDGQPTCAPNPAPDGPVECFGSEATAGELQRAREYTFAKATEAIRQGVLIYPISYGDIGSETTVLLDEIAMLSGLADGHYRAGNISSPEELSEVLEQFFNDITQLVPYVLVG